MFNCNMSGTRKRDGAHDPYGLKLRPSWGGTFEQIYIWNCWGGMEMSTWGDAFNNCVYNYVQAQIWNITRQTDYNSGGTGVNIATDTSNQATEYNTLDLKIQNTDYTGLNIDSSNSGSAIRYNAFNVEIYEADKHGISFAGDVDDNTIVGMVNRCGGWETTNSYSSVAFYGTNCDRNYLFLNISNSKYQDVENDDTDTIWDDKCFIGGKPISGTGSKAFAANSSITFLHGLAGTPDIVTLEFSMDGYGNSHWTATATSITVTVDNAMTCICYWYAKYIP
jgi:hypothetical protein